MSTLTTRSSFLKVSREKLWYHDDLHRVFAAPRLTKDVVEAFRRVLVGSRFDIHPTDLTVLVEQVAKMLLPHCWLDLSNVPQVGRWEKVQTPRSAEEKIERKETAELLSLLASRDDLTREHVIILWTAYANLMIGFQKDQPKPSGHLYPRLAMDTRTAMTSFLFIAGKSTAADVGSFWRLMMWAGVPGTKLSKSVQDPIPWIASAVVMCPATPVEVSARMLKDTSYSESFANSTLRPRMEESYPELAGLPWGMLKDVVESQPIPQGWFVNSLPMPESKRLRLLAPNVLNPEATL